MAKTITVTFGQGTWLLPKRNPPWWEYEIPFVFVDSRFVDQPEEASKTRTGRLLAKMTDTRAHLWGFSERNLKEFAAVLFEYGKRHIEQKVWTGELRENEEFGLDEYNASELKCPFDPARIDASFPVTCEFPVGTSDFGFRPRR